MRKFSRFADIFLDFLAVFSETVNFILAHRPRLVKRFSALSLLMALIFGTNYHYFPVSLDNLALVAHGFYGRSDFHT